MNGHGVGTAAVLMGVSVFAWQACQPLQVAHSVENTRFELRGKHQLLPCEQCHGPLGGGCLGGGKPEEQPTSCMSCHAADVPADDPNHFVGQECFPCHTEEGWQVGYTPTTPEPEPTGTTGDTGPETLPDPNHDDLEPGDACWGACHEADRPDEPDGTNHWTDLLGRGFEWDRWDCGPCHTTRSWTEGAFKHLMHTPHGMTNNQSSTPPDSWIFACTPCHTTDPPTREVQCIDACHQSGDFPPARSHYTYDLGDPLRDCLECHQYGELDYDVPF